MPDANTWRDRVWREFRAGNLTRAYRDVLLTLQTYRGNGGAITPSHATLADRAKCSVRTAISALQQARFLGLVDWRERRRRVGWRSLRSSNSYRLELPDGPVQAGLRPRWRRLRTDCKPCAGEESPSKKSCWEEMRRAASALPDLLALRRAAIEQRLRSAMRPIPC